jgi:hypothetical protein
MISAVTAKGLLRFSTFTGSLTADKFIEFCKPVILGLNTGPMIIMLGMLVLGAGGLRSRVWPRWAGAVVVITPIAVNMAFVLQLPTYLYGLPFVAGMAAFAYVLNARRSSTA